MEINEIRKLSEADINKKIKESKQELFDLRLKQATGNLDKPHQIRKLRKTVAKMKTVLNEKGGK
ncbi:MAG: 50S ribosomal protein L29 [Mollicutes bacterium]|jgi:large subunit ribosomal protein L29|nr:50S ribosomal protein L29 [Mollicutes bacterium]